MRIGLFGGTFDPIHNAHLIIAQACINEFKLDKIIFIPAGAPPHKKKTKISPLQDRYKMVSIALQDNSLFEVSAVEISNKKNIYSYQTIAYFKKMYPFDKFFFIIGSDSLLNIHTWKKGIKLLDMCNFIVIPRPGYDIKKVKKIHKNVSMLKNIQISICATDIRKNRRKGKSIKYLVPSEIEYYIKSKKLYKK
ncbi:nicotinate-nucleotide adenylyltransferase [bacterium]